MHPLGDQDMPRPPTIAVDVLRRLLAEVPSDWHLVADEPSRFLLMDDDDTAQGYLDVLQTRIVLLDGLSDGDDK